MGLQGDGLGLLRRRLGLRWAAGERGGDIVIV